MSILALVAAALVIQMSPAAAQEITTGDPIALFNSVCLGDQVRLSTQAFASVHYNELPAAAKEALGVSLVMDSNPKPGAKTFALAESDVPNGFFTVLASHKVFLMLPAPATATGPAAPQCGVIWRGHHYADALKAAKAIRPLPQTGPKLPRSAALLGLGFEVIRAEGAILGVAEFGNWTILRIAADTSPQEQTTK
jgi:hypothetical protein